MQMRTVSVEVIGGKKSNDRGEFHAIKLVEPVDSTVFWYYAEPDSQELNQLRQCKGSKHLVNVWVENGKVKRWEPAVIPNGNGNGGGSAAQPQAQAQAQPQLSKEDRRNMLADYAQEGAVVMSKIWHALCEELAEAEVPSEELSKMTMTIYIDTRKRFG